MCNDRIWTLLTRKLSGEATHTELEELDMLTGKLPEGSAIIDQITRVWQLSPLHDEDFMEATYLAHLGRMKDKGIIVSAEEPLPAEDGAIHPVRKNWFSFNKLVLVLIIIVVSAGGWILLGSKKSSAKIPAYASEQLKEIKTPKGARTKIKLPDGSDVWLNAGSKLNYNDKSFDEDTREVSLTGEAYFDVVHNEKKPFIIHTSRISVKVLGTQFNVKAYEEDKTTETSLIVGSVEVSLNNNPSRKYLLKPNQKLVLSNELPPAATHDAGKKQDLKFDPKAEIMELTYLHDEETDVESSWTRNILSFEDELFSDVARKMERWYNVTIVFKNKRWIGEYMSGSFEKESLEQAMAALKYTTGFNFKKEGNIITIY